MIYVFDTDTLIHLFSYYYREQFPTLWERFDQCVEQGIIISVREAYNEVKEYDSNYGEWARLNKDFFRRPSTAELEFVREIFSIHHFQALIRKQEQLEGRPVADPFVIAKAQCTDQGCVVTLEKDKPNAAKIPNVCRHFKVDCIDLQQFMAQNDWTF